MIGLANSRPSNQGSAAFDSMFDTEKAERSLRADNSFQSKPHYFNKMYSAFVFRNYEDMKLAAEHYSDFKVLSWIFVYSSSIQTFYEGLVSFWIGRKEKDDTWIEKGKKCLKTIESFAETCSWNFSSKLYLLQAEQAYCDGNLDLAETMYDAAIFCSKEHRFLSEEALANQLSGFFFLETGSKNEAKVCFNHAIEKYRQWEAFGVAKMLEANL